jgi:hypothetical protein
MPIMIDYYLLLICLFAPIPSPTTRPYFLNLFPTDRLVSNDFVDGDFLSLAPPVGRPLCCVPEGLAAGGSGA